MTTVRLAGCRSESLLGYLKALGILRLIATQADPLARGSWDGAVFVLDTLLSEDAIERFFVESYAPTPILNPWNNGAGFEQKESKARYVLRRVVQTTGSRWESYRRVISFLESAYIGTGLRLHYRDTSDKDWKDKSAKTTFLRHLRGRCPDELLPWLDASVILTTRGPEFPYLLGSGGNDGHLDFSVNFAARALDVCGDKPIAEARQLLRDALQDTAQARLLQDVAIGQFSPRHTGGANATSGFDAMSLVNPWDYVLMMEGALLFSGSIGRRTDRAQGRPVFPFALRSIPGGYGSASADEEIRGEMWLPVWDGRASLASVVDLLRKGRIDMPGNGRGSVVRDAVLASDAAAAVITMGLPLGIRRLERTVFAQRNGLAYSATAIGSVMAGERYDCGIAVISRDAAAWIERVRRLNLGAGAREALDAFYDGLFAFPNLPSDRVARARARQELLVALANLDRALARTRDADKLEMPWLDADVLADLDDGSMEHRTAVAIASIGSRGRETNTRDGLRKAGDDATQTLRDLLEGRMRRASKDSNANWLRSSYSVSVGDAGAFLTLGTARRLHFNRLLRAYSHIRLAQATTPYNADAAASDNEPISAAYALLKLVFDNPNAREDRVLRLLFTRDTARALRLAVQRARTIRELPESPRDVSAIMLEDPAWTAAALALPIERSAMEYGKLLDAALKQRITNEKRGLVRSYLVSIS